MTHNQFIKLFSDIATNHRDINSFGNGDITEYFANESLTPEPVVLWADVVDDSIVGGVDSVKYTFLVMDAVNKNTSNDDGSNINEVLSDTLRIAKDIIAVLRQPYYETFFEIEKNITLSDFRQERFDNEYCGWQFDIVFKQDFVYDGCQVNADSLPNITTTDVVTIVDQNGNVVTTLNPGQSYTVEVLSQIIQTLTDPPPATIIQTL